MNDRGDGWVAVTSAACQDKRALQARHRLAAVVAAAVDGYADRGRTFVALFAVATRGVWDRDEL